jgi:hypothetical protein
MLSENALQGIKLLIMPSPYYLTENEAQGLARWVRSGGVLLSDAHLAGYNGTTGRHSRVLPGCGLAEEWGMREIDSTSSYHLKLEKAEGFSSSATEDVRKALQDFQTSGGKYFPIRLASGQVVTGAERYALLAGQSINPEGWFDVPEPCLASFQAGDGWVFYAGTNLGQGACQDPDGLLHVLDKALLQAKITPTLTQSQRAFAVHVDLLIDKAGNLRAFVIQNRSDLPQKFKMAFTTSQTGPENSVRKGTCLFHNVDIDLSQDAIELPARFIDLVILYE